MAADYDRSYFEGGRYGGRLSQYWWARRFYAALAMRAGRSGRLLEIGCGLGHLLRRCEGRFETVGTDVSAYAVEHAGKVATRSQVRQLSAEQLGELGSACFDVIVATHVFEHVEQPARVLQTCAGLLRPGGALVMATPNLASPWVKRKGPRWYGFTDPTHISLHEPATWTGWLEDASFRIEKAFGDGWWDVPYLPLVPAKLQLVLFGLPAILQTVTTVPFIPVRFGEGLIVVARRRAT